MLPDFDNPRSWGRGGAHTASDGQARAPARAAFPSADRQRASAPNPDPAGRSQTARPRPRPPAHAPRLRRLPPARVPPARLHTASRSCTQQAGEAPAVAADRSRSGRCRLRSQRPAEPDLFRAKRARGAAGPHAAALSRPLQPGGQRSHGTTEDRGSRQSASMSARPARPYRRRRAHAAAQRRSGLKRRSLTAALAKRRAACRVNCVTVRVK